MDSKGMLADPVDVIVQIVSTRAAAGERDIVVDLHHPYDQMLEQRVALNRSQTDSTLSMYLHEIKQRNPELRRVEVPQVTPPLVYQYP